MNLHTLASASLSCFREMAAEASVVAVCRMKLVLDPNALEESCCAMHAACVVVQTPSPAPSIDHSKHSFTDTEAKDDDVSVSVLVLAF
jgi:hypothetical protein